jgi:hypothetical protein
MNIMIDINLDKRCVECGKGGATQNALCLKCWTKVMSEQPLRSELARGLRVRLRDKAMRNRMPDLALKRAKNGGVV